MMPEGLAALVDVGVPSNPFPGLRPFEFGESHLYFGRDGQSDHLIHKLAAKRFVAVVGTSGSGKSSLVRAGLLPDLYSGFMPGAGSHWRICPMRPSNDPLGNLARALNAEGVFGSQVKEDAQIQTAITEATLRRGGLGLVEAVRQNRQPLNERLLVVVDQFEELFRFARVSGSEQYRYEAAAFVKLLLEAARQQEQNIYVVLTMRSDFLGDCSIFWGLPEAINEGQYLIPRMTRDQRAEAVTGPVAVGGGEITQRLVNRLLNDTGDNPDMLPILQHALMRTWENWAGDHAAGEPVDLRHYEAVGTMSDALSRHADEAFDELPDERDRWIAERVFKALTEKGEENREVRRPTLLGELCAQAGATPPEIVSVIEVFRREGRSFLMPPASVPLDEESLIDISHESLIRNWKRLVEWVSEESRSAVIYRRLADTAELHGKAQAGLMSDPQLQLTLNWREETHPNEAWARRYHSGFVQAMAFLDKSKTAHETAIEQNERKRKRELRRARVTALVFGGLFLVAAAALVGAFAANREARRERARAGRLLYDANLYTAQRVAGDGQYLRAQNLLDELLEPGIKELRGFEWFHLWRVVHADDATLTGHSALIRAVAFSPDGRTIATGSDDKTVKLWDTASRKELVTLKGHSEPVLALAFSPDGKTLATSSRDKTVKLWDTTSYKELATLTQASSIWTVAFSPDGKTLATGGDDHTVRLWDTASQTELKTLTGHTDTLSMIAFSPDGKTLATGSDDSTLKLWDTASYKELATLTEHSGSLWTLAFSPDGRTIATGSDDKTVKLWDTASRKELATLTGHTDAVWAVAFSPDGRTLATGSLDHTVKLWDASSYEEQSTLIQSSPVSAIAFSPDNKTLATGGADNTVKLWDTTSPKDLVTLTDHSTEHSTSHSESVRAVAFSPDGRTLATSSDDMKVKLWDTASHEELATLTGHTDSVLALAFSPDGRTLATGSNDTEVKLWDTTSCKELATLKGHSKSVLTLAFSRDGKTLATGSLDGTVKLWNTASHEMLATLMDDAELVRAIVFSPDGGTLATSSGDNTVKLWDADSHKELATLPTLTGHSDFVLALSFSPDGKVLATGGRSKSATDRWGEIVKLWDTTSHKELATLTGQPGSVMALAFSPDGKTLATGSDDNTLKLWDTASYKELAILASHTDSIMALAFSPDGKMLATGSADMKVKLWLAATESEVANRSPNQSTTVSAEPPRN